MGKIWPTETKKRPKIHKMKVIEPLKKFAPQFEKEPRAYGNLNSALGIFKCYTIYKQLLLVFGALAWVAISFVLNYVVFKSVERTLMKIPLMLSENKKDLFLAFLKLLFEGFTASHE